MSSPPVIRLKRVYDKASADDGCRVLVDRIWPRGLNRETLRIDEWLKEVAPSTELRQWFGHDPEKWETFCKRYWQELDGKPGIVARLREKAQPLTLVYAAKDREQNNAVALQAYLERAPS